MKVQKIRLSSYDVSCLVLDDNHLPIKPITKFIRYLNNMDKSPFTVRSYAHHLKLFWEYLETKQISWTAINLSSLAGFVSWLRERDKNRRVLDLTEDHAARKGSCGRRYPLCCLWFVF